MKRRTIYAGIFFCSLILFVSVQNVQAVPGQLNYDLPVAQPKTTVKVITDTEALNTCTSKSAQLETNLKNCQNAANILKESNDESNTVRKTYFMLTIISGSVAVILAILLGVTFFLYRKSLASMPSSTNS